MKTDLTINFNNELNSNINLKICKEYTKQLDIKKNIPRKESLGGIPSVKIKKKVFGIFNCDSETDSISYVLYSDGKFIQIYKYTSWDDADGGDVWDDKLVSITFKQLKKIK